MRFINGYGVKKMFCFHKFGTVINNIQYCKKCGKANRLSCPHKWVHINTYEFAYNSFVFHSSSLDGCAHFTHVLRCEKCGEQKTRIVS